MLLVVVTTTVIVREECDGGVVLSYEDQTHAPTLTELKLTASQTESAFTDDNNRQGAKISFSINLCIKMINI